MYSHRHVSPAEIEYRSNRAQGQRAAPPVAAS